MLAACAGLCRLTSAQRRREPSRHRHEERAESPPRPESNLFENYYRSETTSSTASTGFRCLPGDYQIVVEAARKLHAQRCQRETDKQRRSRQLQTGQITRPSRLGGGAELVGIRTHNYEEPYDDRSRACQTIVGGRSAWCDNLERSLYVSSSGAARVGSAIVGDSARAITLHGGRRDKRQVGQALPKYVSPRTCRVSLQNRFQLSSVAATGTVHHRDEESRKLHGSSPLLRNAI